MKPTRTTLARVLSTATVFLIAGAGCDRVDDDLVRDLLKGSGGESPRPPVPPPPRDRPPPPPPASPPPGAGYAWTKAAFDYPRDAESCEGPQLVRFDERQGLHVGVVTCDGGSVRVYLSRDGKRFVPAADTAGHGQDHCELVNPAFRIGHEDDIRSGGCATCGTGRNLPLEGVEVFARARFGEPFRHVPVSPTWSHQVSKLACGVALAPSPAPARSAAVVEMNCAESYEVTGFSHAPRTDGLKSPEVHVLGVYETRSDHGYMYHPRGEAHVRFARTAPSVLVLASYEPTSWTIELADGARLQKVVLSGYHRQTVNLIGKVPVEIHTASEGDAAPYAHQHPSAEADALLRFAAARAGAEPTSFHGCYRATTFSVR